MIKLSEFDRLDLKLLDGKIVSYYDNLMGAELKGFYKKMTINKVPKIYILKSADEYLYVGMTTQSIAIKLKSGLKANGKNGYHGYKWKDKIDISLYVWSLEKLEKLQAENIEAEIVYLIREKTGFWPLSQNEIHFNNDYPEGKQIAKEILDFI